MSIIPEALQDVDQPSSGSILEQPNFLPGTTVERTSTLVVDGSGRAWWVDPFKQTITRAGVTG